MALFAAEAGGLDAERPPPEYGRNSFPLLWLLVPQIAAFAFCGNVPWAAEIAPSRLLAAGIFFLALALGAGVLGRGSARETRRARATAEVWALAVPVAAFFLFAAWWNFRAPPLAEDWAGAAAREAELVFRVEKSVSATEKNFNGFARIESLPRAGTPAEAALAGTRVWYSLPRGLFAADAEPPVEGARVRAFGVLRGTDAGGLTSEGFLNYLRRERVGVIFSRAQTAEILPGSESAFARFCAGAKTFLRERLLRISSATGVEEFARAGRVLGAMLLGERALLSPEQRENFLLTGTTHIFAVSGLHISMLAAGALALLRAVRCPRVPAWALALGGLWLYVQIVGAPPSAMRAWTMLVFLFFGTLFGRGRMGFHGLIFSALVALTVSPRLLDDVGFRLSYSVVAALLLYGVPAATLAERAATGRRRAPFEAMTLREKIFARARRAFFGGLCISFAAFLAGTPCVIEIFGVCTLLSLPANAALIPVVTAGAWLGAGVLLLACVPWVGAAAGAWLFPAAAVPLTLVDKGAELFARVPAVWELSFPLAGLGAAGTLLMLAAFFFGATLPAARERPWLRFGLPPLALAVFLALFAT